MKFKLEVNAVELDRVFETVEDVKVFLLTWNCNRAFQVENLFVNVDEFFEMLKDEQLPVSCYSPAMCEMGDNYVDIELIVFSE